MKRFICTLAQGSRGALAAQRLLPVRLVASPFPRSLGTFAVGITTDGAPLADAPPDTAPTLTAADVAKWTPEQLVDHLKSHSFLEPPDSEVLKKNNISGFYFLRLDSSWMRELGISVGGRIDLERFITSIRTGGPKTVFINQAGAEGMDLVEQTFETQEELKEYLSAIGSAGLRNGDHKVVRQLKQLKAGATYTNVFVWPKRLEPPIKGPA